MSLLCGPRPSILLAALSPTLMLAVVLVVSVSQAHGQTYKILHVFGSGSDGAGPSGGLVADAAGNLYGTTESGGTGNCNGFGCGTVFSLTQTNGAWTETVIHSFQGSDGMGTLMPPTLDAAGNVFATTPQCLSGCNGSVVELIPQQNGTWSEKVLHAFGSPPDGGFPFSGVTFDAANGTVYGDTQQGGIGQFGFGTVYAFSGPNYSNYSILYSFNPKEVSADSNPGGGILALDAAGNLYGTATNYLEQSTIFRLSPNQQGGWTETILYRFAEIENGSDPVGGVILDASGNLYGATYSGGPLNGNYGVIYKLASNQDGSWTFSVLYAFQGGNDGSFGSSAPTFDSAGNLYGTTQYGGTDHNGTVFKLTPTVQGQWTKTILHNFNRLDGISQLSKLWLDGHGNIYGTTITGGAYSSGLVFQITQ
jgi:uncharacterized repeat protein (TIGR03803 family)